MHRGEVKTNLGIEDIDRCTRQKCRIEVHHVGVKTERGVGSDTVGGTHCRQFLISGAEIHKVPLGQCHTLGFSGRTGGVEHHHRRVRRGMT